MALRVIDLEQVLHGPTPARPSIAAVLRWRLRAVLRRCAPREREALQLFTMLLGAKFPRAPFQGEAPGIEDLRPRASWARITHRFGLPPVGTLRRRPPAVAAIFVRRSPSGIELYVRRVAGAPIDARVALPDRLEAARALLQRAGIRLVDVTSSDDPPPMDWWLSAGLLAGHVPDRAPETPLGARLEQCLALTELGPVGRLSLLLLAAGSAVDFGSAMSAELLDGTPARRLAGPDLAAITWAIRCGGPAVGALRWLSDRLRAGPRAASLDSAEVALSMATRLAACARRAVSRAPAALRPRLLPLLAEELGESGLPRAIRPLLAPAVQAAAGRKLVTERSDRLHEARLDGITLGRARDPVQAEVRALVRIADLAGRAAALRARPELRGVLGPTLAKTPSDVVLMERPDGPASLLYAWRSRGGRINARREDDREGWARAIASARAGRLPLVVPAESACAPAAARLQQTLRLAARSSPELPFLTVVGEQPLLIDGRLRTPSLGYVLARPRRVQPDASSTLVALDTPPPARGGTRLLHCRAQLSGADRVALLYLDDRGWLLREELPLAHLGAHLAETDALLRGGGEPAALVHRADATLGAVSARLRHAVHGVRVGIAGEPPHGLRVCVEGEWFGAGTHLPLGAAAEAVLSRWQLGERTRLSFVAEDLRATGMMRLWVRSALRRRIEGRIHRLLAHARKGGT